MKPTQPSPQLPSKQIQQSPFKQTTKPIQKIKTTEEEDLEKAIQESLKIYNSQKATSPVLKTQSLPKQTTVKPPIFDEEFPPLPSMPTRKKFNPKPQQPSQPKTGEFPSWVKFKKSNK